MRLQNPDRPGGTLIRIGDFSRYYRADQLMLIQRVGALRDIGLSIAEIRQLLTLDKKGVSIRRVMKLD